MQEIPNFWDQTHPLSQQAEQLFEQLVPDVGNCDSLQGELLRASSKISYDWYNNGWGCNNWSGAVVFLRDHIGDLPVLAMEESNRQEFFNALRAVYDFSHGEPVGPASDQTIEQWVTAIHEYVVSKVLVNPAPVANTLDMWDLSEPDFVPVEEDDWYINDLDDEDD